MPHSARSVASLLVTCLLLAGLRAQEKPWQAFLAGEQPTQIELPELLSKLSDMLGSPDPRQRDDIAYALLSRWILRGKLVDDRECVRLCNTWRSNLRHYLEETPATAALTSEQRDAAIVRRSFSALSLALLAARDIQDRFLDEAALEKLVNATANYLRSEPDERGYVKGLGWVHTTAHTADLVRQLAKNPRLTAAQQASTLR